jgi:septal ring factor EnvC (AmiA/AmiB activator)
MRPKLSDEERKIKIISGRLTKIDSDEINKRRGKMKPLAWLIETALRESPTIIPELNQEAFAELGKIGKNINQIAKNFNQGNGDLARAMSEIEKVRKEIKECRAQLAGKVGLEKSFEKFLEMQRDDES